MSAAQTNQALVERYVEIVNAGDFDSLGEIVADDYQGEPAGFPFGGASSGPEVLRKELGALRNAFPNLRYTPRRVVADEASVSAWFTLTGTHQGEFATASLGAYPAAALFEAAVDASGNEVRVTVAETWSVEEGRISGRSVVTDTLELARQVAAPRPDPAPERLVTSQTVVAFGPQDGMESIAIDHRGHAFVTTMLTGEIREVSPDGQWTTFARIPTGVGTVAFDARGNLYATVGIFDPASKAVHRFAPDGSSEPLGDLPSDSVPNGIAVDAEGNVFVVDSSLGVVWRLPASGGNAEPWVRHERLAPRRYVASFPGANGVKFFDGHLFTSVSDTGNIVRVPVLADGSAGEPEIYATGLSTDDFAFDTEGNLYATTHPFDTVVRLRPDGSREVLATAEQGVVGPTDAAFGTTPDDKDNLYVVTDGGMFASMLPKNAGHPVAEAHPAIVRLEVGVPGLALP